MGLADRIDEYRQARRAADPVSLEEFGVLLGRSRGHFPTRSGVTITDERALGITAWYSGVRYLAETVAYLPVHTYRDVGTLAMPRRSRRVNPSWMQRPDAETPWPAVIEFAMYAILHRGNSYTLKLRDTVERVVGLRPIHPDRVRGGVASDGTKVFAVKDDEGREVPLTTREVLHIPAPLATDAKFGLSPLRAHAESLGIVAAADEHAGRYYDNASHPGGVISVPHDLKEGEADRLKEEWEAFHRGLKNRERIGVLSKGADYKVITLNAEDSQLLQARQFGITEVARILRIPPHKLYDLTRATYSNIEHQAIEAVMDSIRPWVERIEEFVNFDRDLVPPRVFIEFQLEGLLRGDTKSRYEAYRMALGGHPWMKVSEPRRLENLPEEPGTDFIPRPENMSVLGEPTTTEEGDIDDGS